MGLGGVKMEWIIPIALVLAAAWAVRWQFRDVEYPDRPAVQPLRPRSPEGTASEKRRRAA